MILFMVQAYHVIFTTYGFWLPNDPRGSWSDFVRSWELLRFGPATKIDTRQSVANRPHDVNLRLAAKKALRYPPVRFTGRQARSIGSGFAFAIRKSEYRVFACAILPEHVHMVIARHSYRIEQVVRRLEQAATMRLTADQLHPLEKFRTRAGRTPSPWGRGLWKVYLNSDEDIRRAIRYVQGNPMREHKPPQRWSFVVPYGEAQH